MLERKKAIVLGFGYTAKVLASEFETYFKNSQLDKTSRSQAGCILFDLEDLSTWNNIEDYYDVCFWTFPVKNKQTLKAFLDLKQKHFKKIIMLGTTGSYQVEHEDQSVDEKSPLDLNHARFSSEELMQVCGGVLLRSAGIYGPGRSPLQWALTGRVGPSLRTINWVHVKDLVQFMVHAFVFGKLGEAYIAADGAPTSWQDFFRHYAIKDTSDQTKRKKSLSKKVNPEKSIQALHVKLNYPGILSSF